MATGLIEAPSITTSSNNVYKSKSPAISMFVTSKIMILMATIIKVSIFPANKVSAFLHPSHMKRGCRLSSVSCRTWNPLGSSSRNNVNVLTENTVENMEGNRNDMFEGLLSSALNRAQSTLEQTREFSSTVSTSDSTTTDEQTKGLTTTNKNTIGNFQGNRNDMFEGLLSSALNRAQSTLEQTRELSSTVSTSDSTTTDEQTKGPVTTNKNTIGNFQGNRNDMFEGLLSSALNRAQSTLEQTRELSSTVSTSASTTTDEQTKAPTTTNKQPSKAKSTYRGNPTITNTALAHSLWREILRPNQDSAIDATCGNGHDTLAMAEMLFSSSSSSDHDNNDSKLLALDIQKQACQSTTQAIREKFGSDILEKHIEVRQTSHAPLPCPSSGSDSVGLVVYNLGWLPNANHKNGSNQNDNKDCITKVESTLQSLTDAALMIRTGGMISITTYPKTNEEEDLAVRVFLECLALLSSNIQTWKEFLDEIGVLDGDDDSLSEEKMSKETMEMIVVAMERIVSEGDAKQTFRVSEHRKLGMDRAPILLTAVRIK